MKEEDTVGNEDGEGVVEEEGEEGGGGGPGRRLKPLFPGANEMDQINKIHNVLGTPNARLISKFRRQPGTGISALLPNVSDGGKDILKQMLVYDPETRPNVRRLLEHRYFNDLREQESMTQRHSWSVTQTPTSQSNPEWQNQALINVASNEKRRKSKRTATTQRSTDNQKVARVVSSPNQRSENIEQITIAQASNPKLTQHKKEDISHQRIQGQQPAPPQPYHSQSTKYQVEKTWTAAISSNTLASKSSFNTTYSGSKKINAMADAHSSKNQFHLPKIPVRHGSQKTLPARRGPGTITSLPTLEASVGGTRTSLGSFLRLPPIVVKKTAATLTTASKSMSDTGGGGGVGGGGGAGGGGGGGGGVGGGGGGSGT
ncbi:Cyclin-dependent kinase 5 homolog, partial [Gryllus bimaculatus]